VILRQIRSPTFNPAGFCCCILMCLFDVRSFAYSAPSHTPEVPAGDASWYHRSVPCSPKALL
jgi:hypothetical protein